MSIWSTVGWVNGYFVGYNEDDGPAAVEVQAATAPYGKAGLIRLSIDEPEVFPNVEPVLEDRIYATTKLAVSKSTYAAAMLTPEQARKVIDILSESLAVLAN